MSVDARAVGGDEVHTRSFHRFYREHIGRVTALAIALTADRAAGEDVAQEAFTRAFRDWASVGTYDDPGAWVRRVAINLSHSRWRKLRNESRALRRVGGSRDATITELQPAASELWRAVRQLPRRQAIAIALHYVDDLSVADIAALTGVSPGTTKSDLHRGRRRLTQLLEREDVG